MVTTLNTLDSTLAAIQTALPIDPQAYSIGDRSTGLIIERSKNGK